MDGSADVAWALTAWPTAPCAPVLAPPSACSAFAVAGWVTVAPAPQLGGSRRAVSAASEAEAAIAAAAMASGAVALSVACVVEGRRRRCGRDGNGNGVGRHHGRCILRRLGLIGCRERRRKMPASSRRTSRHRTSPRRTSIWCGGSSRPWCRYRYRPWYRPWRRRALVACLVAAGFGRGVAIIRIVARGLVRLVRCGSIGARAVVGRGLRIVGAARSGRVVLGASCRCCWRPYCCRPAPRSCRFRRRLNPAGRTLPPRSEKMRLPILLT